MNRTEKKIKGFLNTIIPSATEGVRLRVFHKGKQVVDTEAGNCYRFYDIASLTKPVFTVTALMKLYDNNEFGLDEPISDHLLWYKNNDVTARMLLTHTAGYPAWQDLGKFLNEEYLRHKKWIQLQELIQEIPPKPSSPSVYSDIGFLLLGAFIETLYADSLPRIWEELQEELQMPDTHFHAENEALFPKQEYAPTEEKCPNRHIRIQGEVHDENCWYCGGVCSHAGLFSTMDDLSRWITGLRESYYAEDTLSPWLISHKTVRTFTRRAIPPETGDFALGFMLPTLHHPEIKPSCGELFSPHSIGHLSFTGCSFWFDPEADIIVLILNNRTYPSRENNLYQQHRGELHSLIYSLLTAGG